MTNNLIKDNIQLERTNLIRGGTGYSYTPFELKLQLHGQVSNPYNFNIDNDYSSYSNIEKVLVSLYYYARDNILDYQTVTEIPEENLVYLQSGINANNTSYMFRDCSNLISVPKLNIDTSNVTDMRWMFFDCQNLTSLDLSNFNTSNVTNMSAMFGGCSSLTSLDLSNFNTSNVTNMSNMFYGCSSLQILDLSNFDTSNVTNMYYMFWNCRVLTNVTGSLDLTSCTNVRIMFRSCNSNAHIHLKNVPHSLDFSTSEGTEGQHYIIDNYID